MRIVLTESQYNIILSEGKLEDLIQKYENQFGYEGYSSIIENFYEEDPSPTKKYFEWMSKIYIDRDQKDIETDEYTLAHMVKYFDKNQHKFEKKDIYQYTYDEFVKKYEEAVSKISKKELALAGVEKLYGGDNDRYILVRPKNKEASCKYGANTQWCIASISNNYFDNYSKDNLFFFIIDRHREPIEGKRRSESYFKVAIQYEPKKSALWNQYRTRDPRTFDENKKVFLQQSQQGEIYFWNATDDEISKATVQKYIPKELINEFIKIIKKYTYQVYSDYYDKMEKSFSEFDQKKLKELKKIVKEKEEIFKEIELRYHDSKSVHFINETEWLYEQNTEFLSNFKLNQRNFEDFLNYLGIREKFNKDKKITEDLEKEKNTAYDELVKVRIEFNKMQQEQKKFKETISFR